MRVAFLYNRSSEDPADAAEDAVPARSPVVDALKRLGHHVTPIACTLDLAAIQRRIRRARPDVVFNRVESLGGTDSMAAAVTLLLDALKVPYTGNSSAALVLTASKVKVKERLQQAGLPTPKWICADRGWADNDNARFIIKSVFEHASFELDDASIVSADSQDQVSDLLRKREAATERAHFAEEFIDGREFNVSLIGPCPRILPLAEIDFSTFPHGMERIVGHAAKCDHTSFEYDNTERLFDFPASDQSLLQRISELAVECWRLFELSGYARVDFRVDQAQRPWILEINTNPCTLPEAGFAAALDRAGIAYHDGIQAILSEAIDRRSKTPAKQCGDISDRGMATTVTMATICRRHESRAQIRMSFVGYLSSQYADLARLMTTNESLNTNAFETRRSRFVRYGWALGIVCLCILLRLWLEPVLGRQAGLFFWVAILICPWIGGLVPSLIGQTMIWAAQWHWYTPPPTTPWRPTLAELLFIAIYYLFGSSIGVASDLRRKAQQRALAQQAEANSQREQLRATLSCMADGVLVTDEQGRLTLMNPAAEVMSGWTIAESRGKRLPEFFDVRREGEQHIVEDPLDRVLHSGQVVHGAVHLTLTSRAGHRIPIAFSAAPIRNETGNITGGVLVFRDESERRQNEQALRDADRQKDEFLATLAHELRNPLAPICMGLDLLQMSGHDPAASAEVCGMMARQSQHMVRLIDDLMDVSRITRGKLELRKRRIALDEVVQNALDANRPIIDQARLKLIVKLPAQPILLDADPNRLTQVFSNLLNNAAKFTPAEGCIEVSAEGKGGNVVVTVADTGIGIPANKQEFIFDMFTQIDRGAETMASGLGIGLTLVKRLVEMHGGEITVESNGQNQGSRFRVELPTVPQTAVFRAPSDTSSTLPANKRRVLIVDDNADARASLSMVVRALGSETFDAHDGLEAVESANTLRPDVILMDIGMPRLNGYDAARRIRQEPWGHEVLMVATTGWGKEEDRRRSKEAGFDLHLVKPIDISAVQEVLASPARTTSQQSFPVA